MNHFDFDLNHLTDADIAAALCPDLFSDMTGSSNTSAPQGVHVGSITGHPPASTADTGLPNSNAGDDTAFTPTPTTSMGTFVTQSNSSYPENAEAWAMQAQSPIAPQQVGGPHWTGVSPYAANSLVATPNPVVSPNSSATPPGGQDELAWPFGPGQFIYHPTSTSFGIGSGKGLIAQEIGATYPMERVTNEVAWPTSAGPATSAPTAAPVKRRRDESHGDRAMPPQKRIRGNESNGILKAARSAPRTRHKSVARIPTKDNDSKSKEAGRGAERLATPDSQGVYHRSLLGPSLQQGWAVEAADGQLIWSEGRVEEVVQGIDSTVPKQQQEEVEQGDFKIPKSFKTKYRALLVATQADWARGAVHEIKCGFCPKATFNKWGDFKRHCKSIETHPLRIHFCNYCGDYFARSDSCQRHCENRPAECLQVAPEKAYAKRIATKREHVDFIRMLEGSLTTGEDIGTSFSKTMKALYPDSSKKRKGASRE